MQNGSHNLVRRKSNERKHVVSTRRNEPQHFRKWQEWLWSQYRLFFSVFIVSQDAIFVSESARRPTVQTSNFAPYNGFTLEPMLPYCRPMHQWEGHSLISKRSSVEASACSTYLNCMHNLDFGALHPSLGIKYVKWNYWSKISHYILKKLPVPSLCCFGSPK